MKAISKAKSAIYSRVLHIFNGSSKNADVSKFCDVTQISLIQKYKVLVLVYTHAKFQDSTTYQSKVSVNMTPPPVGNRGLK